ncbi:MAG: hypothetical protein GY734_08310 [Herbaspirillum sp.]|uniref:hypothetical protein n=1 Tax=Herbaspirillum sp. TaxID=1890675 RepID=UPI00258964AA|nr:hypothetical protein [Herbaspirillum sp.]MCP3653339.1 hypothetical protein [Herbaspirillum sp.]MCP3946752.1 hypothetical protein [Herbaspirillum sp.]MCP4031228.1 hypothetical protein [Herbaspirillum sp.]MCP4554373.1 hypothetical protein [Herbaspirillum sp.]
MSNLRQEMPMVASMIDDLRREHGLLPVDRQIRRSLRGEAVFYAQENGSHIGTPQKRGTVEIYWDERGISQEREIVLPPVYIEIVIESSGKELRVMNRCPGKQQPPALTGNNSNK